jgi:hypothetical protein
MFPILETLWTHRTDISKKRLEICGRCEKFEERTSRCEACGCFMSYKTMLMNSECPLGKWGKEDTKK